MSLFSDQASKFLAEHTIGTLSTVDINGNVHGAVIYYLAQGEMNIYFVSRTGTTKIRDIELHQEVALTIFEASSAQTLQISGKARHENDQDTIDYVFNNIVKQRPYSGVMLMPPVTALKDSGDYIVICIEPTEVKFSDYRQILESQSHA